MAKFVGPVPMLWTLGEEFDTTSEIILPEVPPTGVIEYGILLSEGVDTVSYTHLTLPTIYSV